MSFLDFRWPSPPKGHPRGANSQSQRRDQSQGQYNWFHLVPHFMQKYSFVSNCASHSIVLLICAGFVTVTWFKIHWQKSISSIHWLFVFVRQCINVCIDNHPISYMQDGNIPMRDPPPPPHPVPTPRPCCGQPRHGVGWGGQGILYGYISILDMGFWIYKCIYILSMYIYSYI